MINPSSRCWDAVAAKKESERQSDFFDTCSECKTAYSCCNDTTPPITRKRRKVIEAYLKETNVAVAEPFAKTEYTFPRLNANMYCVFHDQKTRKCMVHPVKPETCVAGPITFDINVKTGKIEWYVKMDKICQLAGIVYGDKKLLEKHLKSARQEILRLVKELDSGDLRAILKKSEPETFKIAEEDIDRKMLDKLTR
jgi:Fe-S-cluster containining protein